MIIKNIMFNRKVITAYPTDTSFGLGVRADDPETLVKLQKLKNRPDEKYFSLMVRDFEMLKKFAEVPDDLNEDFFFESPKTAILRPKNSLPASSFWPDKKVAFRVCTIPEVAKEIDYPITATSANLSGQPPIFEAQKITENFGAEVQIFPGFDQLPKKDPSEIWDFTVTPPVRIR